MTKPLLIPVTEKIFLVDSPTKGRFPQCYALLILGNETRALIDPGCGPEACRWICKEYEPEVVVNSHCHPDHVSGNHFFAGAELLVPVERVDEVGPVKTLSRRLVGPDPGIMAVWENFARQGLGMEDYAPTATFQDGQTLDFGGVVLTAVHTPGHLEDHYCFWEPEEKILFSFDVDLTTFGPFYSNPESDIPAFRQSLQKIADMAPSVVASSHRLPVRENVREELRAFTDKIDRNQARVARALDRPLTLAELCEKKPIFGKYLPGLETLYTFFERCMVEKHLEEMEKEGLVRLEGGRYGLVSQSGS